MKITQTDVGLTGVTSSICILTEELQNLFPTSSGFSSAHSYATEYSRFLHFRFSYFDDAVAVILMFLGLKTAKARF